MLGPEAPTRRCRLQNYLDNFRHEARILWRIGWDDGKCRGRQSIRRGRHRCQSPFKKGCVGRGELRPSAESGHPLRSIPILRPAREFGIHWDVPTSLRIGPYRFFFYANDRDEPAHVHVQRERNTAKFWIDPVRLERSGRFRAQELLEIQRIIRQNKVRLLKAWDEYFNA